MQSVPQATFGVQAAFRRADASAAQAGVQGARVDIAAEVAAAVGAKTERQAELAVIGTADEMLGVLVDLRA